MTIFVLIGLGTSQAIGAQALTPDLRFSSSLPTGPTATANTRVSSSDLPQPALSQTSVDMAADMAANVGTVDPVAPNQQAGRSRYVAQCSTCHLPVPPAVLPQETWFTLVTDPAHYGVPLTPLTQFDQQLIWNYLRTYSRANWGSRIPAFRVADSVYFTALHPGISFEQPVQLNSCTTCHAQARSGNFRRWQPQTDSPNPTTDIETAPSP
ncbi:MAG: hypothetical protein AAFU71_06175 [Cyanobacteria bacterium J06632_22]